MEHDRRKISTKIVIVTWFVIGALLGAFIGASAVGIAKQKVINAQEDEIKELKAELKLLYEEEEENKKAEVTETAVWETLTPISELSTFLVDYGDTYSITTTRTGIFGETVPFSKNSMNLMYHGVIKVGIDVSMIDIDVDQNRKVITISLPEPKVLDNYIRLDELKCTAKNNILNPLDVTEMPDILSKCAEKGLASAESQNLYTKATANAKLIITDLLAIFPEYRVVFI